MTNHENLPTILDLDAQESEDGTIRVSTNPSFWNATSAFGGWVAAVAVRLVGQHPEFRGEILTEQMQFMRPVSTEAIDVSIELLAQRRTIDFWRVEVRDPDGQLLVTAELTAGVRQPTEVGFETPLPADANNDGLLMEVSPLAPSWLARFEQEVVHGEPFTVADRPRSLVRARPLDDVPFDTTVLAMLCDSPMPRTFFASTDLVFAATLSLSIQTYASDEQIAAVGRDFVVVEADSAVIRNNTLNQEVRVFRGDGILLACSYQTAVFKPPANT
jgi:acyl-coenzyme A thioesterase PaaI-like protein